MSLFKSRSKADRYGVILDIGSGSVMAAIVHSDPKQPHPQIVWSHREHAPLRNIDSLEQSARAVMAALVNSSIKLDAEGRKALYEYNPNAKLLHMQCGISAPWSYTVTKSINYKQEEEFTVTEDLIKELTHAIQDKIKSELSENETLQNFQLNIVSQASMSVLANGYLVSNPKGRKSQTLTLSQSSSISQNYLINSVDDINNKLFTEATCKKLSFILILYYISRELLPNMDNMCLVDVTYEATEIGVVRDGILTYSTHTPYGIFSLAREISEITKIPLHEALGHLNNENPETFLASLAKPVREQVEHVFEAYVEKITSLFKETGDDLSIPKRIALHADYTSVTLLKDFVEKAVKRNLKDDPFVFSISAEILKQIQAQDTKKSVSEKTYDTALLVSAEFFHKQDKEFKITYS